MPLVPPVITHSFVAPLALLWYALVPWSIEGTHLTAARPCTAPMAVSPRGQGSSSVLDVWKELIGSSAQVPLAKTLSSLEIIRACGSMGGECCVASALLCIVAGIAILVLTARQVHALQCATSTFGNAQARCA